MDEHRDQHPDPADGAGRAQDEALARLRAADPAADARLDACALRAEVARRVAAGPAGHPASGADRDGDAVVVPLAARRRSRWLQVAAVAAAAAVVAGAGGYAVGATGGGGDAVTADAPITLTGPAAEGTMAMDGAASTADMRIAPWFGGRAVFSASGLADDAGSGHAWAFDAASVFSAETAARVAGVLGVTGDPVQQYGSWTVGPQDGSGPTVSLQPDGTAGVSYYDPTRDPWSCTASATDQPDASVTDQPDASATDQPDAGAAGEGEAGSGAATLDPALVDPALPGVVGPSCDPTGGPAPAGDAATSAVRDLLGSLGVDPDGYQYEVVDTGDARSSSVTAYQVLDGQQTGLTWSVTLVADGVQSLYGSLAPLVDLGEYPVVGAATAVERLNDPRFGTGSGGAMPLARAEATDGAVADDSSAAASADPTVPPTARPGAAIPWSVQQVTITGARLGVTQVSGADGAALLVPAYELTDADGSTWSVIAVDEGSLDLAG